MCKSGYLRDKDISFEEILRAEKVNSKKHHFDLV